MWESIDGGWSVKIRFDVCDWVQSSPGLVQASLRASPWGLDVLRFVFGLWHPFCWLASS